MSIRALQEYTRFSKYARFVPELGRRETWDEQVSRVFTMHREKLGEETISVFKDDFEMAEKMVKQKKVLGSQRALQFGGKPILSKNERLYNCSSSYCDRARFFQEAMYLLLCGCGVGFSVQTHHIEKLPNIKLPNKNEIKTFVIPDSIEGWADAVGVLMSSYFQGENVPFPEYQGYAIKFDFSKIRPAGSPISSGSKAPGPDGLKSSLIKIECLLDKICKFYDKLRPIDAYDIMMHASDAVLSGGVRRSATICLFSPDDDEMASAKTGRWRLENPQRARSNNSVLLVREKASKDEFLKFFNSVREYGEPGFVWADHPDAIFNPCVEVSLYPKLDLNEELLKNDEILKETKIQNNNEFLSGWAMCNLCEINAKKAKTKEDFLEACKAASIIGTIQASYTDFPYLGVVSELIIRSEALLGVSMTGMADNPEIAFNATLQRQGAKVVLEENEKLAKVININPCSRATCVKPAGSSSCVLGTASGIHPHHAKRYFRRVQANKLETPLLYFEKHNPLAVEESVWSNNHTDMVITFLCEVPDGAKTKNQVDALSLLENVKLTQQNWVEYGTRYERIEGAKIRHNVSNTCSVKPDEWDQIANHIYLNRRWYAGISLLPVSGDKDYPQAPFTAIMTPHEIVREYGDGSMFASGLIVDGLRAFDENLWAASDCVLGIGEIITVESLREKIERDCVSNGIKWKKEGLSPESPTKLLQAWLEHNVVNYYEKVEWVRRAKQFAQRYFKNDVKTMTYCIKDVTNWKKWCDLSREYVEVDWGGCFEDEYGNLESYGGGAGEACAGGKCELGDLGAMIEAKMNKEKTEEL